MRSFLFLIASTTVGLLINPTFGAEKVLEPRLMEAVRVYTLYKTTEGFSATCKKWERHTSPVVDVAVAQLLQKHSVKIAEANSVLSEQFWREHRKYLDESVAADMAALDQKFREATEELRRDWCERFPQRIEVADRELSKGPQYEASPESLPFDPAERSP